MPNTVSNTNNAFAAAASVAPIAASYGVKSVSLGRKRGYYALPNQRS
ncbi:MAG: hypothetical protein ACO1Q7_11665 [Gemmatimonas sp.]